VGAMSENEVLGQEPQFAELVGLDCRSKTSLVLASRGHDTAGKQKRSARRKQSRPGSGNSVNDSGIGGLRWRWSR
jgi:hypothetical protein